MTEYLDSHAHLTSPAVYPEVEALLKEAQEAGVTKIVNICTDAETLERGMKLEQRFPWVKNAAATTPHDVDKEGEALFPMMAEHARSGKLVAVGETGLDYHYNHSKPETQKHFLRRYLQLALECRLPVVIHCREAFNDFFRILDEEYPEGPGVLHCFTGTVEEAKKLVERGWMVSFSGIVTFKKSEELREAARIVPIEQLLIETDTPYLAPQSRRGKPNRPAYIVETAGCLAELKGIQPEQLTGATKANAEKLFRI